MPSRASRLPKFIYRQRVNGHTYYRFRRGPFSARIPGEPGSAEFHAAYAQLLAGNSDPGRYNPGSVAHTITLYLGSAEFDQLALNTQRDYRRYLHRLDNSVGERAIDTVDAAYLFGLRDRLRETPTAANHAVAVISALFRFAFSRGIVGANPTEKIPRLKGGDGYRLWPEAQIIQFRSCKQVSDTMQTAFELGLNTGQRLSDVIRLAWSNYNGDSIWLRQQKTINPLTIPLHPDLKPVLDATPRRGLTILTTVTARAYHPRVFSREFLEARRLAGTDPDLSFHGLRHTAASRLAEAGASGPEIMAITGHKSLRMVEHYIRQANQERQARNAIARLVAKGGAK